MTEQRPAPSFEKAALATLIIVAFILALSLTASAVSAATLVPGDDSSEVAEWRTFDAAVESYMGEINDIGLEAQAATSRETFSAYLGDALRVTIDELNRFHASPPAPSCAGTPIDDQYLHYLEYTAIALGGLYYNATGGLSENETPASTDLSFQIQDHFYEAFTIQRVQAARNCAPTGEIG